MHKRKNKNHRHLGPLLLQKNWQQRGARAGPPLIFCCMFLSAANGTFCVKTNNIVSSAGARLAQMEARTERSTHLHYDQVVYAAALFGHDIIWRVYAKPY